MSEQSDPYSDAIERVGVEEQGYLLARAAAHRAMAERSNEAGPRLIHARLEELYRERATTLSLVGQA